MSASTRTILNLTWVRSEVGTSDLKLLCGSTEIFNTHGSRTFDTPFRYVCSEEISGVIANHTMVEEDIYITSVPYDLTTVEEVANYYVASSTVPYGDWLLVNAILLFFIAFIPVSALVSLIRKKR